MFGNPFGSINQQITHHMHVAAYNEQQKQQRLKALQDKVKAQEILLAKQQEQNNAMMSDMASTEYYSESDIKTLMTNFKKSIFGINFIAIGKENCGKSSLLNKLAGKTVCKVGQGHCTTDSAKVYKSNLFNLWDCSPTDGFFNKSQLTLLLNMDKIIILFEHSVKEVLQIIKIIKLLKIDYIVVRTKCDQFKSGEDITLKKCIVEDKKIYDEKIYSLSCKSTKKAFDWEDFSIQLLSK